MEKTMIDCAAILHQPHRSLRHAMATAPVGDDVYSDDPTVKRLENGKCGDCLASEDAVYMVTAP